eukprot:994879-Prorocentrum_lima.AAC.1
MTKPCHFKWAVPIWSSSCNARHSLPSNLSELVTVTREANKDLIVTMCTASTDVRQQSGLIL